VPLEVLRRGRDPYGCIHLRVKILMRAGERPDASCRSCIDWGGSRVEGSR
jgi:hypothetical protein